MGLDGICQQRKASQSQEDLEKPEEHVASGWHCFTSVSVSLWLLANWKSGLFYEFSFFIDFFFLLIHFPSEWKTWAAVYGGDAWEEAQAAAGREESKKCLSQHSQQM